MKYNCGHSGCDVCGARQCDGDVTLKPVGRFVVCCYCIKKVVKLAVHVSESFSTCIDPANPCGRTKGG